jgi:hypothetical protein
VQPLFLFHRMYALKHCELYAGGNDMVNSLVTAISAIFIAIWVSAAPSSKRAIYVHGYQSLIILHSTGKQIINIKLLRCEAVFFGQAAQGLHFFFIQIGSQNFMDAGYVFVSILPKRDQVIKISDIIYT